MNQNKPVQGYLLCTYIRRKLFPLALAQTHRLAANMNFHLYFQLIYDGFQALPALKNTQLLMDLKTIFLPLIKYLNSKAS